MIIIKENTTTQKKLRWICGSYYVYAMLLLRDKFALSEWEALLRSPQNKKGSDWTYVKDGHPEKLTLVGHVTEALRMWAMRKGDLRF